MVSRTPGSYHGFGWALDRDPSADSILSATLLAVVALTNIKSYETNWVLSLECKILTEDKGRLIERLGELVGRSVGKEIQNGRF